MPTVPASVTIEQGQTTSPAFNLNAVNDSIVDGTQNVIITASATAHDNGTDTLDVTDDDTAGLMILLDAESFLESAGEGAATVRVMRNTDTTSSLLITLLSDDTSEATVPPNITIDAGQLVSAEFTIEAIDDNEVDGDIVVTITASADSHTIARTTITVIDDDDDDHDGVENSEDNCQFDANHDQLNSDTDFLGDACDDDDNDSLLDDNDSLLDDDDNCPLVANFDQLDANGNGVGDVCDFEVDDLCIVIKLTNGGFSVVCL
jgi:hypothetical protein